MEEFFQRREDFNSWQGHKAGPFTVQSTYVVPSGSGR